MPLSTYSDNDSTESIETGTGYENPICIDIEENEENLAKKNLVANHELIAADAGVKENPLNAVSQYYLVDKKGHMSSKDLIIRQGILFAVAVSGAGLYATAADAYAISEHADTAGRINYMVSTCIPALVVLYNSTELYLNMRDAERIPEAMSRYLVHSVSPIQKKLETIAIWTGAAISALPLAAVSYMYPIPGLPKAALLFQGGVVLLDNTILHLFPIKLAFSQPLYRSISLPFEFLIQEIRNCLLSQEEKEKKQFQVEIDQLYSMIKHAIKAHFSLTRKHLNIYGIPFSKQGFINEAGIAIRDAEMNYPNALELLTVLLQRLNARAPEQAIVSSNHLRGLLRKAIYLPGAFWVISSCIGYLAAPINEMTYITGSPALGVTLAAPPIYFLGVLLAFFGGNALQNTFDYLTDWNAVKIPVSFKLYPKTAVLLVIISMYLSAFSYAAGAQLINDNFKGDLEFLRPYLLFLAKTGLSFLGFTAMVDFFNNALSKFGQYGGSEDTQTVIQLSEALSQMENSIQLMKPELLLESLSDISIEQFKNILNIKDNNNLNKFSSLFRQLAEKLKIKLIKKVDLIDNENNNEVLDKLKNDLKNDYDYKVSTIDALLNYFNEKPELQRLAEEYKLACKILDKLDILSEILPKECQLSTFSNHSINSVVNDGSIAGPSSASETSLLIPKRRASYANFYGEGRIKTSLSPEPDIVNSNQMRV